VYLIQAEASQRSCTAIYSYYRREVFVRKATESVSYGMASINIFMTMGSGIPVILVLRSLPEQFERL
jgi:hypothetical protein